MQDSSTSAALREFSASSTWVAADLLALEDMLVELLLQALICQVDAELLKAVLLEALKPVDIQNPNGTV